MGALHAKKHPVGSAISLSRGLFRYHHPHIRQVPLKKRLVRLADNCCSRPFWRIANRAHVPQ